MIIVGANLGSTSAGKPLRDGGAAVVVDGRLEVAIAEERLSRVKAQGGYARSLKAILAEVGASRADRTYLSSCCQSVQASRREDVAHVDHHLSHASLAYFASENDVALICVADAGGDVLSQTEVSNDWWEHSRQQMSVYLGKNGKIELLDRQFHQAQSCGIGEMYRAVTHYLGWPSGRHAGKTMALSAYGGTTVDNASVFFTWSDGVLRSRLENFNPLNPHDTCRKLLLSIGRDDLVKMWEERRCENARAEIASIAQSSLEFAISCVANYWREKIGTSNLCLSGGVALNCTATMTLRDQGFSVFVPAGAGDNGQSVGNAILGYVNEYNEPPSLGDFPFLGIRKKAKYDDIRKNLLRHAIDARVLSFSHPQKLLRDTSMRLFNGEIIFWHQGRSEFGARALGNRSILANPLYGGVTSRLNELKRRESFNPFAASCTFNDAKKLFSNVERSPYMTIAFKSNGPATEKDLAPIIHEDGSCRAHVISRSDNPRYFDLLSEFKKLSGLGIVLNTSLNGPGEPITETISDTLELFSKTSICRTVIIDDFVVEKQ